MQYVVGQVLEDGRKVLEIEDGVPVLSKAPAQVPPAPVPAGTEGDGQAAAATTPAPQPATKRKSTPRKPGPKSVNTAAVSEKLRTAGTPAPAQPAPQVAPNTKEDDAMATKKKKATKAKGKAAKPSKEGPAGQPKYRDLKVALPATRAVGSHQRLTEDQIADLRGLRKRDPEGYTWRRLGYIFGTTDTTAQGYCEGKKPAAGKRTRKK